MLTNRAAYLAVVPNLPGRLHTGLRVQRRQPGRRGCRQRRGWSQLGQGRRSGQRAAARQAGRRHTRRGCSYWRAGRVAHTVGAAVRPSLLHTLHLKVQTVVICFHVHLVIAARHKCTVCSTQQVTIEWSAHNRWVDSGTTCPICRNPISGEDAHGPRAAPLPSQQVLSIAAVHAMQTACLRVAFVIC
jgi:hypothetical protein